MLHVCHKGSFGIEVQGSLQFSGVTCASSLIENTSKPLKTVVDAVVHGSVADKAAEAICNPACGSCRLAICKEECKGVSEHCG